MKPGPPPGLLPWRGRRDPSQEPSIRLGFADCQTLVLVVTFVAYALFHAARKPPSIVKSVLTGDLPSLNSTQWSATSGFSGSSSNKGAWAPPFAPAPGGKRESLAAPLGAAGAQDRTVAFSDDAAVPSRAGAAPPLPGWPPFNSSSGLGMLGEIDMVFLSSYAVAMFFFGQMGDRVDLRVLLASGMLLTAIFTALFGAGFFWEVHSLSFFLFAATLAGLMQASGWPCVVAIMANWHGHSGRGLTFGIWNSHTSFGNIFGALAASVAVEGGWGWAFVVPAAAMAIGAVVVYLFLPASPGAVGMAPLLEDEVRHQLAQEAQGQGRHGQGGDTQEGAEHMPNESESLTGAGTQDAQNGGATSSADVSTYDDDEAGLLEEMELGGLIKRKHGARRNTKPDEARPIGFLEAWAIPGVAAFALCLFFAKLVAYTFLYWLPYYISRTEIEGHRLTAEQAGVTSTVFDIGGVLGGIVAGHLSDVLKAKAVVTVGFLALVAPALGAYVFLGATSLWVNVCLLAAVGFLVNGPYALITCAVSADLGQHPSLEGNARALATVTGIIDGTGSVGAAIGPFITGMVSEAGGELGWALVFVMLCTSTVGAVCCILHLAWAEIQTLSDAWQASSTDGNCRPAQGPRFPLGPEHS